MISNPTKQAADIRRFFSWYAFDQQLQSRAASERQYYLVAVIRAVRFGVFCLAIMYSS